MCSSTAGALGRSRSTELGFEGSQVTWTFDDILKPLLFKVNCISHVLDVTLRGWGTGLLLLTSLVQSREEVIGTLTWTVWLELRLRVH